MRENATMMQPAASIPLTIAFDDQHNRSTLTGDLTIRTLAQAQKSFAGQKGQGGRPGLRAVDLAKLRSLDTPAALFLSELRAKGVELTGVSKEHQVLIDVIGALDVHPVPKPPSRARWREIAVLVGKHADDAWRDTLALVDFVGRCSALLASVVIHPSSLRPAAISRQISQIGVSALPIVGLMAIMISVVIGYQSVAQLRPFGGEDYTINLVAVSVLREMGVLITAIMVAGRSGSAFAAEIGVMKMREEVDALEVMGVDPMQVLVAPRLIAIVITLPLLAFYADIMGLLGGAMISQSLLDVSLAQYFERVRGAIDGWDFFVGLFKAPVLAFAIGIVGCMHGLRVKGSAESAGRQTTSAVVQGIFLVIILDALFSILFERLGI